MNWNLIRTFMNGGAIASAIGMIASFMGCSTLATGAIDCSTSWLSPMLAGFATLGFALLNFVIKMFQGQLVAPTVAVSTSGTPGTVKPSAVVK